MEENCLAWYEFIKKELLEYFREELPGFLCNHKQEIYCKIEELEKLLGKNVNDITVQSDILEVGTELIKLILEDSIRYLSKNGLQKNRRAPYRRSIDNVNRYVKSFVKFEEYLFGIDFNYRDHLLHSLWVYLLGHEFINKSGGYDQMRIMGQASIPVSNSDGDLVYHLFQGGGRLEDWLKGKGLKKDNPHFLTSYFEAMWGMIALLHDFGYPIEKISDFPQQVNDTLKKFGVDFGSIFQIETGSGVALLFEPVSEIISTLTRPKGLTDGEGDLIRSIVSDKWWKKLSENENDGTIKVYVEKEEDEYDSYYYIPCLTKIEKTLFKPILRRLEGIKTKNGEKFLRVKRPTEITKSEEQEYEFKIAFARKKHPAWSAIYAFSNIAYLHMGSRLPGGGHDYLHLLTVKDILYSIVHHFHEAPTDYMMNRFPFILLLMDDIEEIGRYSKGGKPRGIEMSRCKMRWEVTENCAIIEFDYREHKGNAKEQFDNLKKKYENQQCKSNSECSKCDRYRGDSNQYIITIKLVDGEQMKPDLKMCLWRDL